MTQTEPTKTLPAEPTQTKLTKLMMVVAAISVLLVVFLIGRGVGKSEVDDNCGRAVGLARFMIPSYNTAGLNNEQLIALMNEFNKRADACLG